MNKKKYLKVIFVEKTISFAELANLLGCTRQNAYILVKKYEFNTVKQGRGKRIVINEKMKEFIVLKLREKTQIPHIVLINNYCAIQFFKLSVLKSDGVIEEA